MKFDRIIENNIKSKHIHELDFLRDQNIINFDRIIDTCQYQIRTHPWFRLFQGPTNGKI